MARALDLTPRDAREQPARYWVRPVGRGAGSALAFPELLKALAPTPAEADDVRLLAEGEGMIVGRWRVTRLGAS